MAKDSLPKVPPNPEKSWHKVVERPNTLIKKIPRSGGVDSERAIVAAESIVRRMSAEYVKKLGEDIREMKDLAYFYNKEPSRENLDKLFRLIHNMRGQGATFGFPLITEIGRNFCLYVREMPEGTRILPELVDQHLKAMEVVYHQSIKGGGDEIAKEVVKALSEVVEAAISNDK